jgi:hypothetical protein
MEEHVLGCACFDETVPFVRQPSDLAFSHLPNLKKVNLCSSESPDRDSKVTDLNQEARKTVNNSKEIAKRQSFQIRLVSKQTGRNRFLGHSLAFSPRFRTANLGCQSIEK